MQKKIIHENASEKMVCEMAAILSGGDELMNCYPTVDTASK